ncbi:hypothetical protein Pmani_010735 [Petrolisthes manimaculis]|uniref:Uncharacterized protein n=1 Tax=Petrolisthes manimaculis TaxID=1843537 RepID=A0AAE1UBQ4_9EUCA|nr:hypothetical protein Pmani_010735 [Petrolisthes manimaculis]
MLVAEEQQELVRGGPIEDNLRHPPQPTPSPHHARHHTRIVLLQHHNTHNNTSLHSTPPLLISGATTSLECLLVGLGLLHLINFPCSDTI